MRVRFRGPRSVVAPQPRHLRHAVEERRGDVGIVHALEPPEERDGLVAVGLVAAVAQRGDRADHLGAPPRHEELELGLPEEGVPRGVEAAAHPGVHGGHPRGVVRVDAVHERQQIVDVRALDRDHFASAARKSPIGPEKRRSRPSLVYQNSQVGPTHLSAPASVTFSCTQAWAPHCSSPTFDTWKV